MKSWVLIKYRPWSEAQNGTTMPSVCHAVRSLKEERSFEAGHEGRNGRPPVPLEVQSDALGREIACLVDSLAIPDSFVFCWSQDGRAID